uniref:Putative secreted protein n=1 Tax=Panstrongylus lignarius TaxID=156445 RepID=A0A224Y2J1_9HEMI
MIESEDSSSTSLLSLFFLYRLIVSATSLNCFISDGFSPYFNHNANTFLRNLLSVFLKTFLNLILLSTKASSNICNTFIQSLMFFSNS